MCRSKKSSPFPGPSPQEHVVLQIPVLVQSQPAASATQLQPTISQVLHQIPPAPSSTSLHLRPQPTMFGSQLQLPSAATALPQYQCKYSYISQLQPPSASLFPRCSLLLPAPDSTKLNCIHRHCPQPLAFRLSFPPQLLPLLPVNRSPSVQLQLLASGHLLLPSSLCLPLQLQPQPSSKKHLTVNVILSHCLQSSASTCSYCL
eukprot:superscaffoldBa00001338_g10127